MSPGELVADRFEIEAQAGAGGMGFVYRALDRHTGEKIALKVLHSTSSEARARFTREARVLAELRHPGIVRYVAHGTTPAGQRYIAMEWLSGEDLQQRLRRESLTMNESVRLVERAAEAIASAHGRGVVHRDIKPSNIFLVDGAPDRIKVLDFGIARMKQPGTAEATIGETNIGTSTGMMLGTIGYLAPEQARGARDIGMPADVFSLGCVLFRCITGRQPFVADDPSAVLAKILFEDAPRAHELRVDVPAVLDELVARMLAKDPTGRPKDAAAVATELSELTGLRESVTPHRASSPAPSLGTGERRLVSVVVAAPRGILEEPGTGESQGSVTTGGSAGEEVSAYDATMLTPASAEPRPATAAEAAATVMESDTTRIEGAAGWKEVRIAMRSIGAQVERLADGVVVATLAGGTSATDQAALAARSALALRERWPEAPMALATGRGVLVDRLPVGDAIDRAMRTLRRVQQRAPAAEAGARPIALDDVTAGLLDTRFEIGGDARGLELRGEREVVESIRTLLGKTTPFVGREAELAVLQRIYEECADAPQAQAVLVTAPSGVGKSRLRYELLRSFEALDEGIPRPQVWMARGDAMSVGSPFGLLSQVIRRAAGVRQGEPLVLRQQKLRARLARYLEGVALDRVGEFLAELVGAPVEDGMASVQLRAARQDSVLMGDQRRRAWEDWVAAECSHQPVLVVLEDLQWGDVPSVGVLDAALRNLREKPFMVLALARPEVHDLFPKIWAERRVQEIRLGELTRRPAEKLVRQTLGADVPPATVQRIVELAAGNAFYMEELIRAVAEGQGDALPETVLAMVQARLESLDADARWILRAASVFGGAFWRGGLLTLLGGTQRTSEIDQWLAVLVDRELVSRRSDSRFPAEEEFAFRHALVREAAYAMLTDDDRKLGHRLAAEWLERVGETDPAVLAEHYDRAQEPARAIVWYENAAVGALEGNDFAATLTRAERAIACGATGADRGELRLIQAEARRWAGEHGKAVTLAEEAIGLLPPGTPLWFAAAGELGEACGKLGDAERLRRIADTLAAACAGGLQGTLPIVATARTTVQLLYCGQYEHASRLLAVLEPVAEHARGDPAAMAWLWTTRATQSMFEGDVGEYLVRAKAAVDAFERAGDLRNVCRHLNSVGFAAIEAGAHAEAETALADCLERAERMNLPVTIASARQNLGVVRARQELLDQGRALEEQALEAFREQGDLRMEGGCLVYLAIIELAAGRFHRAHEVATAAATVLEAVPPGLSYALAMLAQVELARGEPEAALRAAERAHALLEELGIIEEGEAAVRLAWADALAAVGRTEEARAALERAKARLLERAALITDPILRQCFLENIPDNARTLERAS